MEGESSRTFRGRHVVYLIGVGVIFLLLLFFTIFVIYGITRFEKNGNIRVKSEGEIIFSHRDKIVPNSHSPRSYRCFGSCYCENDERRSAITNSVVTKSLIYFVSTISTISAISLAKNHFEESCHQDIIEFCDKGSILSEVEDCEEFEIGEKTKHLGRLETSDQVTQDENGVFHDKVNGWRWIEADESDRTEFRCHGICMSSKEEYEEEIYEIFQEVIDPNEGSYPCEKLEVTVTAFHYLQFKENTKEIIEKSFKIKDLHPYCVEKSDEKKGPNEGNPYCVGYRGHEFTNPSVKCTKVD